MKDESTSYFASSAAASRYVAGRIDYHARAVETLRARCSLDASPAHALDVGSGTGLSSLALARIAGRVTGVDVARPMIAEAQRSPGVRFVAARAERLPFRSETFDLIAAFSAFHWFDQDVFLAEARRVLRRDGHLCFAQYGFTGHVEGHPEFARWRREVLELRYPPGPKRIRDWTRGLPGFTPGRFVPFRDPRWLTPEELVAYMLSQSAIERSGERPEAIQGWLEDETGRLLGRAEAYRCVFQGYVSTYRPAA